MSEQQFNDGETIRPAFPDVNESERPYTKVSYGLPYQDSVVKHVNGFLKAERVYIVASKSLSEQTDKLKVLEKALGEKHIGTWIGIPSHTPFESLIPIINDMRAKKADCLVTLGGGSLADGAKIIVYALENGVESVDDLLKFGKQFYKLTPESHAGIGNPPKAKLVFIPTTLSGGEYSRYGGAVEPETKLKVMFSHPGMFASLVVLDGGLCRTTPDWVWRSTGVRAVDHCCESICAPDSRKEADIASENALRKLMPAMLAYTRDENDLEARLNAQLGCNLSMTFMALRIMAGASHGIGHQLGPLGVGHGQTSCIMLPAVMKYNASYNQEKQDKLADILWSEDELSKLFISKGLSREKNDVGDALRTYFNELGMPKTLAEVGVKRSDWPTVERNTLLDKMAQNNSRPIKTEEDVREILEMVAGDN